MSNRNDKIFPITLLLFLIIEVFLAKSRAFEIGIFFYLIYGAILFVTDKRFLISFFVFQLPIFPIIPTDFKLFGLIGPHEIVYGFSFFTLLILSRDLKVQLNKYQKLSIKFVYFLFFINSYVLIKDVLIGLHEETELSYVLKNIFRFFLYYSSVILLIKVIYYNDHFRYAITGIKFSLVVLVISMIFTNLVKAWDIGTLTTNKASAIIKGQTRFLGIYGAGGDENSAGVFLVAAFGFMLALFEKNGKIKNYILFMGFAVLGTLLTGSRTAFMALTTVILIFLFTNKSGSAKIAILLACVVFYFIFSKQLDLVIQRFFDPSAREAIDPNDTGRVGKWIKYTEWILNHPETLIFGNQIKINYDRAPHNYFIFIIYHAGIIPLLIFLRLLYQLLKSIKFYLTKSTLKNAYYVIPFPFIIMTVNSFGSSIYLWLFLPIGAYYLAKKN
ncbi:MAG: hypothetical protein R2821_02715 [Flavobacteriaceae bacterium]|jgi:hypothetical protein